MSGTEIRQAVTYGPGRIGVSTVPAPLPGPGEVVVAVEVVGVCGSDLHIYAGTHPYRHFPIVQGHEIAGRIVAVGPGSSVSAGARVVVEPLIECGRCFACRRGHYNACSRLEVLGVHRSGGFADRVVVPQHRAHPVGDLDPELAVLCEPVGIALQAVERAGVGPDDRVVVIGGGSIGRSICLVAADRGARVLIADREWNRLRLARRLGAEMTVNTTEQDLAAAVNEFTADDGAGIVIEATGVPSVVATALELAAPSGTVVIVGVSSDELRVPVGIFTRKELTVLGSRNSAAKFPAAIDLVARRRAVLSGTISHRFTLDRAGEAMALATERAGEVSKAVLVPGRTWSGSW